MKLGKSCIAIFLCVVLFVSCSSEEKKKPVLKYDEVTQSTLGSNNGNDPKEGIGFDGTNISVGIISPQTGTAGFYGNALKAGSKIYWDAKNNTGGVGGKYKVKIISRDNSADNTYDKDLSVSAYDEISSQVVAFQQIYGTDSVQALKDKQIKNKQLIFPVTQSSSWVRNPLTVPITDAIPSQVINGLGFYLSNSVVEKPKLCSLFEKNADGDDAQAGIEFYTKEANTEYVSKQIFVSGSKVSEQIENFKNDKCNVVVYSGSVVDIKNVINEFSKNAPEIDLIGLSQSWMSQLDLELTQKDKEYASKHFYVVLSGAKWGDLTMPGMAKMMEDINNFSPNQNENVYFMYGYAQAWALDQVLELALENGDLTPEGVSKALSNIDTFDFGGLLPAYEYGPNSKTRVVPDANTIYLYNATKESKLLPVNEAAINYVDDLTSTYVYKK